MAQEPMIITKNNVILVIIGQMEISRNHPENISAT